ncbi:hypothetical protein L9F63_009960, partial [Diploptera punctata]
MAGKDGTEEVVKQGLMVKRSVNKKRFTPVNYKQRWFVLTRNYLTYYDTDGERRKERGRIDIGSVQVVETAQLSGSGGGGVGGGDTGSNNGLILEGPGYPFQVGYQDGGQEYTLYLLANRDQDRVEWITALRAVCSDNSSLSERYHVGLWSGKRWTCCRLSNRSADGCDSCTSWSRNLSSLGLNKNESVESINNNPAALARLTEHYFLN